MADWYVNPRHETYIVMYDGRPIFAFDVRDNADLYIEKACKIAIENGYRMEKYSRDNFYVMTVNHFY